MNPYWYWLSQHRREVAALALIACGVWWLMPRPARLPKIVGLILALGGAGWLATRLNATAGSETQTALFFAFSAVAIGSAILMITNRNPVYSALWFAITTLGVCGLFLLQSAPFLAAATVTVYAGAIVVTFVFVIMLAQQSGATEYDQRSRQPLLATLLAMVVLGALLGTLQATTPDDVTFADTQRGKQEIYGPTVQILVDERASIAANALSHPPKDQRLDTMLGLGRSLFGDYLFAVELAGTLLLVATIGAIAIAPRRRRGML